MEGPIQPITSPEEELAYLRAQIAVKEQELAALQQEKPRVEIARERIVHHRIAVPDEAFHPTYTMPAAEAERVAHTLSLNLDPASTDASIEELRGIMETKGVKNAMAVLDKLKVK